MTVTRPPASVDERPDAAGPLPLGRRAGRTMVWGQVSKTLEALLTLAIAVAAVRALNPNAFGLYSLMTYLAGSASMLIPVVMVEAAAAVLPRFRDARERVSLLAFVAALRVLVIVVAFLVLLPGWDVFRDLFGLDAISYRVFVVGMLYWTAQDLLNSVSAFYLAELDLRPVAVWRPIGQVVTLATIVYVAATEDRWSSSVGEVLTAVALGFVVTLAGLVFHLRRYGTPRPPSRDALRSVLGLTPHTWVIGVLTFAVATQVDVLLIGAITGNSQEVAFYVAAVGVVGRAQSLLLSGWLSPIIPSLSHAALEGGRAAMARVWELFAKLWLFVALPINALLLVLAHPLIETLFGRPYKPAGGLLVWSAAFNVAFAFAGGTLGTSALWALDRQRTVRTIKLVTGVLNIALAVVLIDVYGALGAVIATGSAAVATAAAELVFAARHAGLRYPTAFAARVAAAGAAATVPALLIRPHGAVGLLAAGIAGVAAYAAAVVLVRPFSADDLRVLERASPVLARSPLRRLARD